MKHVNQKSAFVIRGMLTAVALSAGLASLPAQAIDVVVGIAPPPVRYEPVPQLGSGYVWAPGYWAWDHGRYVWIRGHRIAHRPGYRWVPDHWEPGNHYRAGFWEPDHGEHRDGRHEEFRREEFRHDGRREGWRDDHREERHEEHRDEHRDEHRGEHFDEHH